MASSPKLANLIARDHAQIVRCWLDLAGRAASARGLAGPELANVMPRYLSSLAGGAGGEAFVESHFSTRLRQGFQVAEVAHEFSLLAQCILERCTAEPAPTRPEVDEIAALLSELTRVSLAIVEMFHDHMRDDEQTEKRFLRQLREVATAGLHAEPRSLQDEPPSLQNRMRALLDRVMEAMGAQSAAVLLRVGDHELVTMATAGAESLVDYATTLGAESFAAKVAGSEEPTALWDVTHTEIEVPASLQQSGIRSLLGAQLRSRTGLYGILYVGNSAARAFGSRDSRRLESLAEHLVAHLDAALLFGRLTTTIATLQNERAIREQFVAILAHDLRGPLAAARLGAELMARRPEPLDAQRARALRVEHNLDRMERMIRDLLDVGRIRAGERLPLRLDCCDLAAIAREVAEELRMLHGDRFVVTGEGHVPGVWSADELRRALWNLASNAVKYGAPDRVIELRVRRHDAHVQASVHNEGAPIPADELDHLFEPYARAPAAIAGARAGWGLGLTLVRGCAEAHGGAVHVTSDGEHGTTFTLELPIDARPYQVGAPLAFETRPPSVH
jgi:signal transduction histidine kinase